MEEIKKECPDCHNEFSITVQEQEWYKNKVDEQTGKSFTLPNRCPDCRRKRREAKNGPRQS